MSQNSPEQHLEDLFDYVADVLRPNERTAFETLLDQSIELQTRLAELKPLAADLATVAPSVPPTANLKQRLMSAIDQPGPALTRQVTQNWLPAEPDGVEICTLRKDLQTRRELLLLRMRPGASYPIHSHPGAEDCYVISGDLLDGSIDLVAGDFIRFPEGTEHGPILSRGGCVLLLDVALDDHTDQR